MLLGRCPQQGDFDSYSRSRLLAFRCNHWRRVQRNDDHICRKYGFCKAATIRLSVSLGTNAYGLPLDAVIWLRLITNQCGTDGAQEIIRNYYALPVPLSLRVMREHVAADNHLVAIATPALRLQQPRYMWVSPKKLTIDPTPPKAFVSSCFIF